MACFVFIDCFSFSSSWMVAIGRQGVPLAAVVFSLHNLVIRLSLSLHCHIYMHTPLYLTVKIWWWHTCVRLLCLCDLSFSDKTDGIVHSADWHEWSRSNERHLSANGCSLCTACSVQCYPGEMWRFFSIYFFSLCLWRCILKSLSSTILVLAPVDGAELTSLSASLSLAPGR